MALIAADLVDDLSTYLGSALDVSRATLVLELALERAAAIISPVPDEARAIVVDAAARAYSNPQGAASETVGPFGRTFQRPGVYLTRQERADLRRLKGSGGAFTVNPIAPTTA